MSDLCLQVHWREPSQAHASLNGTVVPWARQMIQAGHTVVAEFRLAEDVKTDKQRRYYHGVILKEISLKAKPNGVQYPLAVWKEHFRAEFLGFKTVTTKNPITGKKSRRRMRVSTEDLGVKAYAKLIERVTAFAVTELGVQFSCPTYQHYETLNIDPDTGEILP